MKSFNFLLLLILYISINCSQTIPQQEIHFTASTPGDSLIKRSFGIPNQSKIDFIRWDLKFLSDNSYQLKLNYGIGKPNTLGFEGGGQKANYSGKYEKLNRNSRTIYDLKGLPQQLLLIQVSPNLLHVLTDENNLMNGNGGWSYTINRMHPVAENGPLPYLSALPEDNQKEIIYEGRTPCIELASQYNIEIPGDCIKLKWLLTLNRNPGTLEPSTYSLKRTLHRDSDITGKWKMVRDPANNNVMIIQLDPNEKEKAINLMIGDRDILFFLNADKKLITGNGDFSYTLNRRRK